LGALFGWLSAAIGSGSGLLDYWLASNHVHLLLDAQARAEISDLMLVVAGEFVRNLEQGPIPFRVAGDEPHDVLVVR
jgi:hypothetical protein